jgi:hypothetical protein
MPFPVAAGHPDYSSAGTSKFIPEIWSTKLLIKFYEATVFADISNTDYEGEITGHGSKVIIRTIPNVVIKTYVKGQKLVYDTYESAPVELEIDKGKYFAFGVDNVDKRQADIDFVSAWSTDASEQMKIAIDVDILADIYADVSSYNKGATAGKKSSSYNLGTAGSSVAITKSNVIDYIVDCASALSECNIPETNRWMVLPTWMSNLLKKSDLKDASMTGDGESTLRNGRLGKIDNFTLYVSNNYTAVSDTYSCYHVLFGHKSALTFASQMVDMETLKNPDTFGDLIRGMNVYGYNVNKPESIGDLYCRKG